MVNAAKSSLSPAVRGAARGALVCLVLGLFCQAAAHAASVTASLDRSVIRVGESASLSLTFEGGAPANVPGLPAIPNLEAGYSGRINRYEMVNGRSSSTVVHTYTLTPSAPGEYTVPAVRAILGNNEVVTSQPVKLTVLKSDAPPGGQGESGQAAFVRLMLPKRDVFVGEVLPVEIHLYVAVNGQDLQAPQLKGDGFTVHQIGQPSQVRTQLGGTAYNVVIFKTAVTAARNGELSLGPAECKLTLQVPQGRGRREDIFDPFDMFGPRTRLTPVTLRSEPVMVNVQPLPETGKPADFGGAVGTFSMKVSATPTNVAVGDPITLKVEITGTGSLDALAIPDQGTWQGFRVYPATAHTEPGDPIGISGTRTFEQVIVPQDPEVRELPPLSLSYFEVKSRQYQTLTGPAIPLTVRPPSQAPAQPTFLTEAPRADATPEAARDIVHIKAQPGSLTATVTPLVLQPWFLAFQGIPLLAWSGLLARRRWRERLENNPRLRRRREVARYVRSALEELRGHAAADDAEPFFATTFRLLQECLGERLDLPSGAITEAVIGEHLQAAGLPEASTNRLHRLFQLCNQARYAPQRASGELKALTPEIESALQELQGWKN